MAFAATLVHTASCTDGSSEFGVIAPSGARAASVSAAAMSISHRDGGAPHRQRAAEEPWKRERVVHRATVRGEGGPCSERRCGLDLGLGIREREDDLPAPHLRRGDEAGLTGGRDDDVRLC